MSEPMSNERLAEIRERILHASPGPWRVRHRFSGLPEDTQEDEIAGLGWDWDWDDDGTDYGPPAPMRGIFARHADAAFVASARTDIPDLLSEIDRLRAVEDALLRSFQIPYERPDRQAGNWQVPERDA